LREIHAVLLNLPIEQIDGRGIEKLERACSLRAPSGRACRDGYSTTQAVWAAKVSARRHEVSSRASPPTSVHLDDLSIAGADAGSLLSHMVFSLERTAIRDVYVGGEPVIQDGRHPLQEEIVREFREMQRRLWGQG
jgi:hypothetical protein